MPYRLFPYERRLGLRELTQLGLTVLESDDAEVLVIGDVLPVLNRSTYFDRVLCDAQDSRITQQSLVESAHRPARMVRAARQRTRYGLHGVHEYKGKFNPQVVRALCNVVDPRADLLIDPFCGSGTAPLEALRMGLDVLGIDRSPMAWMLASTKVEAAATRDKIRLADDLLRLAHRVADELDRGQFDGAKSDLIPVLGSSTERYLRDWFPPAAFAGLSGALRLLRSTPPSTETKLALVALSSVLRRVSLQMPEDLRIRRRREPFDAPAIAELYWTAAVAIRDGLAEMSAWDATDAAGMIVCGSADDPAAFSSAARAGRRLILTSPPYATALPYIDTDRLSIATLGLAGAHELMTLERGLVGSREWIRAEQARWDDRRTRNADALPPAVTSLTERIRRRNVEGKAGFRRLALPSLLYRYFADMAAAMSTWTKILAGGELAVLIVGHNQTTAGDQRIDIATPTLLAEVAASRGFDVLEVIELETWPRYGLHSANGVSGEDAVVIRCR